jgi:hypothetical protein
MDNELKGRWVRALKSTHYAQGKKALRSENDKWCCLGVLCNIIDPDSWEQRPGDGLGHPLAIKSGNYLNEKGLCVTGLTEDQMHVLARLNDHGTPFHIIANVIQTFA